MRTTSAISLICLVTLIATISARAQDISIKLNGTPIAGSPFPADSPIAIPVGSVTGETVVLISDENPGAAGVQHGVGQITIAGTLGGTAGRLSLVIARNVTAFPTAPDLPLAAGVSSFGTTTSAGLIISDTALRDHTRLAMSVSGDVRGAIDVGQVFRVQADGIFPDDGNGNFTYLSGGTIYSDITAHASDDSPLTNVRVPTSSGVDVFRYSAMQYVRAGRGITGKLRAVGGGDVTDPDTNEMRYHESSITRVIVGPHASPTGVQGDIEAHQGHIGIVYTTGPIGSSANIVKIRAADGIDEIRAIEEDVLLTEWIHPLKAKALDFYAEVRSDWDWPQTATPTLATSRGFLHFIQTDGAFHGSINAGNLTPAARFREGDGLNTHFHSGVLVRGIIDAPITVRWAVSGCDLVGTDFPQPIFIGISFQGILVATGRDTPNASTPNPTSGWIESIDVGNRMVTENDPEGTDAGAFRGMMGRPIPTITPSRKWESGTPVFFDNNSWVFGYTPNTWLYGGENAPPDTGNTGNDSESLNNGATAPRE